MKKLLLNVQIISVLIFMLLSLNIKAQVKTRVYQTNIPENLFPTLRTISKEIILDAPKEFKSLRSKEKDDNDNRFAVSLANNINLIEQAEKFEDENYKVYILKVVAKDALNISLEFGNFYLSENAILAIYNEKELTDSITSKENNENNIWATRVYQGNTLNIVLKTPLYENEVSKISISKVNFGYKEYGTKYGEVGSSGACQINVNCPLGNGWNNEKNSVALIVANGTVWCTGALVMNTCGTNIPYLLTANHCLQAGNEVNWVFQFQFWSSTCTPNSGWTEDIQFNGCKLRANNTSSDFALLELNQTPPTNSGINYAGWSRSTTPANNATAIHHPSGDLMKISRANNPVVVASAFGTTNQHWRADWSPQNNGAGQTVTPVTEGGSSGSPLFDQNHRIVGQLHGGPSYCNGSQLWDFYGRFDLSWTGGGTNSTRLSNWLDSDNKGVLTTNTTNVASLIGPLSISGANSICNGVSTYTLNGVPAGNTIVWSVAPNGIVTLSPNGNTCTVTRNGSANGQVTLTATVSACSTYVATKTIDVGLPYTLWGATPCSYSEAVISDDFDGSPCNSQCYSPSITKTWCAQPVYNATNVTWQKMWSIPTNYNFWSGSWSGHSNNVNIMFKSPNQNVVLKTTISNQCGSIEQYYCFYSTAVSCNNNLLATGCELFDVSFIASSNRLKMKAKNETEMGTHSYSLNKVQIVDKVGYIAREFDINEQQAEYELDLPLIKSDIYFIVLQYDDCVETHQIGIFK
ncbi:MAG: serine protease [Chitinophagales bacterium]|nr:serine protease [Chitinophagales bacterium]